MVEPETEESASDFSETGFINDVMIHTPESPIKSIPRHNGNRPEPAARKVPTGICKAKTEVRTPKKKIATPSISKRFLMIPTNCKNPASLDHGERLKTWPNMQRAGAGI